MYVILFLADLNSHEPLYMQLWNHHTVLQTSFVKVQVYYCIKKTMTTYLFYHILQQSLAHYLFSIM